MSDSSERVDQLRAEGQVSGSGLFSVSPDLQWLGLDRRAGLHLLKWVQFAVAGGCQRVEIRLGRGRVEVRGTGAMVALTRPQVERACADPLQVSGGRALRHLAWALLLAHPFRAFELALEIGAFDGIQWRDSGCASGFCLRLEGTDSWGHWLQTLTRRSSEHRLLYERCCYAPIPVHLDGRLVNNPDELDRLVPQGHLQNPSFLQYSDSVRRSEILVERNWLARDGPRVLASLPTIRTVRQLRLGDDYHDVLLKTADVNLKMSHVIGVQLCEWLGAGGFAVTTHEGPQNGTYPMAYAQAAGFGLERRLLAVEAASFAPFESPVSSRLAFPWARTVHQVLTSFQEFDRNYPLVSLRMLLPLALSEPSRLVVVTDGVALDSCGLEMPCPGWVVLAAADHLSTDLSQLRLVENEALGQLKEHVAVQAREMLADFWGLEGKKYPEWVLRHMREHGCQTPTSETQAGT